MNQSQPEYKATLADLERMDRVHDLITANKKEFEAAASLIDRDYSHASICARAAEQRKRQAKAGKRSAPLVGNTAFTRFLRLGEIPEILTRMTDNGWSVPTRRWRVYLGDLIENRLPVTLPGADWETASQVMLAYWITCDERAEAGPPLSEFQRWRWDEESPMGRDVARCWVADWSKFNEAVDIALAVAKRRRLSGTEEQAAPNRLAQAITHAQDFTWLSVRGRKYTFTKGQRARVLEVRGFRKLCG